MTGSGANRDFGEMPHPELPDVVYKYTNEKAARLIIANRTLRIGRPTEMNDPFDGYIGDLFDVELKDHYSAAAVTLVDMLSRDPAEFAKRIGVPLEEAIATSATMNAGTAAQRDALLALLTSSMIEDLYPQLKVERKAIELQKVAMVAQFRNCGIFCATRNNSNLLMWSHYADEHRGFVFGFRPDAARDSFLCLLEPVTYSDDRSSFYKPFDPLVGEMPPQTSEAMRAFTRSLTAVKSTHWAYEEELRIVIPSYVPEGQSAVFIPYYATELAELYLGHRVATGVREELVAAARAVNKDVAIFQARITPRSLRSGVRDRPVTRPSQTVPSRLNRTRGEGFRDTATRNRRACGLQHQQPRKCPEIDEKDSGNHGRRKMVDAGAGRGGDG